MHLTSGELLFRYRENKELSQADFSQIIGVSRSYLCDLEAGRRLLSIKKAIIVANALKISSRAFVESVLQDVLDREELMFTVRIHDDEQ